MLPLGCFLKFRSCLRPRLLAILPPEAPLHVKTPISVLLASKSSLSVQTLPPSATVAEAVKLMNQHKLGCVLVTYVERLVGIFTERDVLTRVLGRDREPATTPLNEVMTVHPLSVLPSDTVEQVMTVITGHLVRRLPVIDRDGTIVGLISIGDLARWLVETHGTGIPPGAEAAQAATSDRNRGRLRHGLPPQPSPGVRTTGKAKGNSPVRSPKTVAGASARRIKPPLKKVAKKSTKRKQGPARKTAGR